MDVAKSVGVQSILIAAQWKAQKSPFDTQGNRY
jgi:hypothetical protein